MMGSKPDETTEEAAKDNALAVLTKRMVRFAERWFPDSYVFVLVAVVVAALGAMLHGRIAGDGQPSLRETTGKKYHLVSDC